MKMLIINVLGVGFLLFFIIMCEIDFHTINTETDVSPLTKLDMFRVNSAF